MGSRISLGFFTIKNLELLRMSKYVVECFLGFSGQGFYKSSLEVAINEGWLKEPSMRTITKL